MASRFVLPFADVGAGIKPADGSLLYFFEENTIVPKDTFSVEGLGGGNENSHPVVADADGLFPDIWLPRGARYKVILEDKNNVQRWEAEPVVAAFGSSDTIIAHDTIATMVADATLVAGDNVLTFGPIFESWTIALSGEITLSNGLFATRSLSKGPDVASATTLILPGGDNYFDITGTVPITSIATIKAGARTNTHFDDSLLLTHSGALELIPDSLSFANDILTQAGDEAEWFEFSTGNSRLISFKKADGSALKSNSVSEGVVNFTYEPTPGAETSAINVTDCNEIILRQNGDDNQVGKVPARVLRLTNTIKNNININNSGPGGLDTGARAANTDYYTYIIAEPDGTFDFVWSANIQFPDNTTFPTFIYAHRFGWAHADGAGLLSPLRKTNLEFTYPNDGNNQPVVHTGLTGGVYIPVQLLPNVSPEAQRVGITVESRTALTTVAVATNALNIKPVVMIAQGAVPLQMDIPAQMMLESSFLQVFSTDPLCVVRVREFEDTQ